MNRNAYLAFLVVILSGCFNNESQQLSHLYDDGNDQAEALLKGAEHIEFLYKQQRGGVLVTSVGRITKILDNQQTPYVSQRILIRLSSGRKILIQHNLNEAPAVNNLAIGEMITFSGIYNWNSQGGMINATHQIADLPQRSGWLKYQDITYQ
ncbi:DUF3465 domain-containing protein [Psychromonas sp. psych-6C06]|uniref:DUF3465 domain-containing protein n=1 Tax=Psychromonas sp. psych-6C06 TaxID=2058089 RepID=UPI00187CF8B3|nr:DUF3465 domain-containing protein [Psychromonas sp. psych-6C06]